ncbi:ribbon-helix-helix protein, CopG family [Leuconostoc mesenteroides]|uniref:ribbon-helix-helix protein, CopG family n=1 Tax=Leuconostoc mesenteroides TaxID=1245 RepID=UPI00235E5A6E|nr:ribbon-helix-helix protein, CopG family [Leuconostoc mesenteroides]
MQTVRKEVRGLDKQDLDIIDQRAQAEGTSTNELLRIVITDYAKRIREDDASNVLHSYLDDLIMANNNVVHGLNDNTIAIGEMFKTILARLEMYFPDLNDEVERIQRNARPQEKNLTKSIDFDEFE